MVDIYELGLKFLNETSIEKKGYNFGYPEDKPKRKKRRKSRDALEREYKRALEKYRVEKEKSDRITKQVEELASLYDSSYQKMQSLHEKMENLRANINKLDDEGGSYLDLDEPESDEDSEEDEELSEESDESEAEESEDKENK